jgi:hypothetical protein
MIMREFNQSCVVRVVELEPARLGLQARNDWIRWGIPVDDYFSSDYSETGNIEGYTDVWSADGKEYLFAAHAHNKPR